MVGGTVGSVAHIVMPQYTADVGAYALVGMGTTFAGIVRTPLTSVIMIFEMTRDYSIIVPLMISNLVSFYISYKLAAHADLRSAGAPGRNSLAERGNLDVVLHRMGGAGIKVLPVVSRSDVRRVEGLITLDDVLRVYGLQGDLDR